MKRAALIACDNGLGHVRRCYLIGLELAAHGWTVDLYAPQHKFVKFVTLFGVDHNLRNVEFSTATTAECLRLGEPRALNWHRRVPSLEVYQVVLSDNLPEVLYVRPDAILSGHFFWHDVLSELPHAYVRQCEELIVTFQPPVVASSLFASVAVSDCRGFIPVGLYGYGQPSREAIEGNALLITGGSTPAVKSYLETIINRMKTREPRGFQTVFVDPDLLPHGREKHLKSSIGAAQQALPAWMKPATYDNSMYSQTICAICRPGVGTVTDLLQRGARPFCLYELGNTELSDNAHRLHGAGLGNDLETGTDPLERAERYVRNGTERRLHGKALARLSFSGALETVQIIEQLFN